MEEITFAWQQIDIKKTGTSTLGTDFLKNYLVTVDWPGKTAYFEKLATDSIVPLTSFGFHVILHGEILEVAQLIENSPAYAEGLRLGDQILKVNDSDYTTIQKEEYCSIVKNGLVTEEVNEMVLTFQSGSHPKTIHLKRECFSE